VDTLSNYLQWSQNCGERTEIDGEMASQSLWLKEWRVDVNLCTGRESWAEPVRTLYASSYLVRTSSTRNENTTLHSKYQYTAVPPLPVQVLLYYSNKAQYIHICTVPGSACIMHTHYIRLQYKYSAVVHSKLNKVLFQYHLYASSRLFEDCIMLTKKSIIQHLLLELLE
jgi:hypothetical protein